MAMSSSESSSPSPCPPFQDSPVPLVELPAPAPTYFDGLPDEIVEAVLRHVSERPRREDWASFVSPGDAHALFSLGGPLTRACRRQFTAVSLAHNFELRRDGALHLDDKDAVLRFPAVAAGAGPSLARVSLAHHFATLRMDAALVRTFAAHCTGVRALDLASVEDAGLVGALLAACAGRLRALTVNCNRAPLAAAVAASGAALEALTLLRRHVDLSAVWETVGATLCALAFEYGVLNAGEVARIRSRCRALASLDVRRALVAEERLSADIAGLYSSYGAQLRTAELGRMQPGLLAGIARACPQVRISTQVLRSVAAVLRAVGARLYKVRISFFEMVDLAELTGAAEQCPNISELTVFTYSIGPSLAVLGALFASPKPKLEVLSVRDMKGLFERGIDSEFAAAMSAIEQGTSSLRNFSYDGYFPPRGGFRGVLRANYMLERIELRVSFQNFDSRPEASEPVFVQIVESLVEAHNLRELIVNDKPFLTRKIVLTKVENATNLYRFRRTHIRICGINYRP